MFERDCVDLFGVWMGSEEKMWIILISNHTDGVLVRMDGLLIKIVQFTKQ